MLRKPFDKKECNCNCDCLPGKELFTTATLTNQHSVLKSRNRNICLNDISQ